MARDKKKRDSSPPATSGGNTPPAPAPAGSAPAPKAEAPKRAEREDDGGSGGNPIAQVVSESSDGSAISGKAKKAILGIAIGLLVLGLIPWGDLWSWLVSHSWGLAAVPILVGLGLLAWKKPGAFWTVAITGGIVGGILYFFWWEGQQFQNLVHASQVERVSSSGMYPPTEEVMDRQSTEVDLPATGATGWIEAPIGAKKVEFETGGLGIYVHFLDDLPEVWHDLPPGEKTWIPGCHSNVFKLAPRTVGCRKATVAYCMPRR